MKLLAILFTLLAGNPSEGVNTPTDRLWAKSEGHATVLSANEVKLFAYTWPHEDDSKSD
jgi:hypothetical protein